jgi:hypothetical protein
MGYQSVREWVSGVRKWVSGIFLDKRKCEGKIGRIGEGNGLGWAD